MPNVAGYAKKYGIPIGLAHALIGQESGGRSGAVSSKGATGLTQVMPETAAGLLGVSPARAAAMLKNPSVALDVGFKYLAQQKQKFGSWRLALAAYNAGPGAVEQYDGIPPYAETRNYVSTIMSRAGNLTAATKGGGLTVPLRQRRGPASVGVPQPQSVMGNPYVPAIQASTQQLLGGTYNPSSITSSLLDANRMAQQMRQATPIQPRITQQGMRPPSPGLDLGQGVQFRAPKTSRRAQEAVALAKNYLGTPYAWGGEKPGGFDCSGLLQYVWAKKGVEIPRVTYDQWHSGTPVKRSQLKAGDAVFFHAGKQGPEHVGMYIGGGQFIEAPHTGAVVRISRLAGRKDFLGARRFA